MVVILTPLQLESRLIRIPGIVETGLFLDMAEKAYFGMEDGKVVVVPKPVIGDGVSYVK